MSVMYAIKCLKKGEDVSSKKSWESYHILFRTLELADKRAEEMKKTPYYMERYDDINVEGKTVNDCYWFNFYNWDSYGVEFNLDCDVRIMAKSLKEARAKAQERADEWDAEFVQIKHPRPNKIYYRNDDE